jgi:hypothetical protein
MLATIHDSDKLKIEPDVRVSRNIFPLNIDPVYVVNSPVLSVTIPNIFLLNISTYPIVVPVIFCPCNSISLLEFDPFELYVNVPREAFEDILFHFE